MPPFLRSAGRLLGVLLLPLLASCDASGIFTPGVGSGGLRSGTYAYDSWSDDGTLAWWGDVELTVHSNGEIEGRYRLPAQCETGGYVVDCVGWVGGRSYSDGTVRFGLDEGWLRNEGWLTRRSEAEGRWETRILGYYDEGDWELRRY